MPQQEMELAESRRRYWRSNLRVTFGGTYYARELSFNFLGWPFGFWVAAQGSLVVYCLIVWFYARYMAKLDMRHGVQERED